MTDVKKFVLNQRHLPESGLTTDAKKCYLKANALSLWQVPSSRDSLGEKNETKITRKFCVSFVI